MLEITALLDPISADSPTGADLRATGNRDYIQLKDARLAARQQEHDALREETPPAKDLQHWHKIIELSPKILMESSKDLTVACWFTEALTRIHGFSGLHSGLELLNHLIELYWDAIYPAEDEDGIVTKLAPLIGLNGEYSEGTLIVPINSIELTNSNHTAVAAWQYQQSLNYARISDDKKKEELVKEGVITPDQIREAVLETKPAHFDELQALLENCLDLYKKLVTQLNALCGSHYTMPTSNIQQALAFNLETIQVFKRMLGPAVDVAPSHTDDLPTTVTSVSSKQQAFDELLKIADYFRQTEPHSPVPYLLEQAVRWGNLALPDLLAEILPEPQSLNFCLRLIGVKAAEQSMSERNMYGDE